MKVLFDFYEISLGKGKSIGIYNYALELLKVLADSRLNIEVVVACNKSNSEIVKRIPNIEVKEIGIYPNFFERLIWRLFKAIKLGKALSVDIYYSPKGFAPGMIQRNKRPYIVLTIHDMIPFYYFENHPRYFNWLEQFIVLNYFKNSIRIANKIVTISQYSKQMILKYSHNCDESKVKVIYNGVAGSKGVNAAEDLEEMDILNTQSQFIFAITSNLPHKNKENLIGGYIEYLKRTQNPLTLKICGIKREDVEIPDEFCKYIEFLGFVDEKELSRLYSNATLFMFLPYIEGFGFPPFEALASGTISIVSDITVLKEVLGDKAYFVDPVDPYAISDSIREVLSRPDISRSILLNKENFLRKYSWEKGGQQIVELFADLLNHEIK